MDSNLNKSDICVTMLAWEKKTRFCFCVGVLFRSRVVCPGLQGHQTKRIKG